MNPYKSFSSLVFLMAVMLWAGCQPEVATLRLSSLETYFPLELNRSIYYRVDSVILVGTLGGIRYDSSRTEARETLVEAFTGADGETLFRGERWERKEESRPFQYKQTFTVGRNAGVATRSEDNLTFTKLVRPIRKGVTWDGNSSFNTNREVPVGGEFLKVYKGWEYGYRSVDSSLVLSTGVMLDSVLTVRQADVTDNRIEYRYAYERYVARIGLVEKFVDARDTQCKVCCNQDFNECNPLPWDEKAEQGYIIHQTFLRID